MRNFTKEIKDIFFVTALSFVVVLGLTKLAISQPVEDTTEVNDPLETINRGVFKFNRVASTYVLDPVVTTYKKITPDVVERSISNFFSNLGEPMTVISSVFQGDWENTKTSAQRFGVNTVAGPFGLRDVATKLGLEKRSEDLGQALAVRNVQEGPYIVLPLIGSSNLRDSTGTLVQAVVNPVPTELAITGQVVGYSKVNEQVNTMLETSVDPYVLARESYQNKRAKQIGNIAEDALNLDADAPG